MELRERCADLWQGEGDIGWTSMTIMKTVAHDNFQRYM